jgi:hypothetical protein
MLYCDNEHLGLNLRLTTEISLSSSSRREQMKREQMEPRFGGKVTRLKSQTVALLESANRQRATTQTPQGLDATHGNEVFPVNESCAAPSIAPGRSCLN